MEFLIQIRQPLCLLNEVCVKGRLVSPVVFALNTLPAFPGSPHALNELLLGNLTSESRSGDRLILKIPLRC